MNDRLLKDAANILIQLAIKMGKIKMIKRDLGDPIVVIAESIHFTFVSQQCMEQFQHMSLRMFYQKYRAR